MAIIYWIIRMCQVLSTCHLISLGGEWAYYSHFTDEEMEVQKSTLTNISQSTSPHFHHQLCDPTLNISCQDNQRSSNYSPSHKHLCFLLKIHPLYWSQWDLSKCKPDHVVSVLKTVSWLPIAMVIGIKFVSVAFQALHGWPLLPLEPHLSPALCKSDIGLLAVALMSPFTCLTWALCTCCSFCWYFLTSKLFSCT